MITSSVSPASPSASPIEQSSRQAKLKDAAQQFEGMFLQELLKPLQSGNDNGWDEEKKSDSSADTLSGFGVESVAKAIAARGGLGIAGKVIQQVNAEQSQNKQTRAEQIS